jgi:hypothetical protein
MSNGLSLTDASASYEEVPKPAITVWTIALGVFYGELMIGILGAILWTIVHAITS